MRDHYLFMGAGGVGSYVGGRLAATRDVTLVDPWPAHIDAIKEHGLRVEAPGTTDVVRLRALHIHEVQQLRQAAVDVAFLCVKSYDTAWAVELIAPYLSPDGFIVSLQNGFNEERIARTIGWDRVLGCIASTIGVNTYAPGAVARSWQPGGDGHIVFRVGEPDGIATERAQAVADALTEVDSSAVTENLWGERWSKLAVNSMVNGLAAIAGLTTRETLLTPASRHLMIALGGEALGVATELGFEPEPVYGQSAERVIAAASGHPESVERLERSIIATAERIEPSNLPSTVQDIRKGRRTEADGLYGYVAAKSRTVGRSVPVTERVLELLTDIELGRSEPGFDLLAELATRAPAPPQP